MLWQQRAGDLGVKRRFETEIESAKHYVDRYDLVVASDGINSGTRSEFADHFKPDVEVRACKFVFARSSSVTPGP